MIEFLRYLNALKLSHYEIVNAVFRSLKSIMTDCEHIHKEGVDLASLAGGILLEIRNTSLFITCYVMPPPPRVKIV